jgi:mannose-1-phosphate guanylyltransferase
MLHAVIMAGGAGTRFWPASRVDWPKQLLDLTGEGTLIESTVRRLSGLVPNDRLLVITNRRLVPAIRSQLAGLPPQAVLGEPCKRDTAPCLGLAAVLVQRHDPDATLLAMPADHVIRSTHEFQAAVRHALDLLEQDPTRIVTFGIRPTYPAESFGYIERQTDAEPLPGPIPTYQVSQFREKPDADTARQYLETGKFYWNSGIFVWKAKTILDALARYEPAMEARLRTIAAALGSPQFEEVLEREFSAIVGKSIDYAVMEHYPNVLVMEAPFDWDDVGNWQAVARLRGVDEHGNTVVGRHLGIATRSTIVSTDDQHLVVTVGLEECIVVHTPGATLVADRCQEELLRQVVKQLEERNWHEYL